MFTSAIATLFYTTHAKYSLSSDVSKANNVFGLASDSRPKQHRRASKRFHMNVKRDHPVKATLQSSQSLDRVCQEYPLKTAESGPHGLAADKDRQHFIQSQFQSLYQET
jgi:hypothetical protein